MKNIRYKTALIAFLSVALCGVAAVSANSACPQADAVGTVTCQSAATLADDYFSAYAVPTDMFTYEANGGGTIANAFDGNWNSYWKSEQENSSSLINAVTVTFDRPVTVGSIAYAPSSERTAYGYPQSLKVYLATDGDLALYGSCNSTPTNNRVRFVFGEPQTVTAIKFEFTQPNKSHNWIASAKEIMFLQPESEGVNSVLDLFTDYTQHTVKDEYRTELSRINEAVKDYIGYESALKPLLDRAEAVVSGKLQKDERLEFSTDPNARNVIERWGNLIGYAKGTLKVNAYGYTTNRQATGIGGLAGSKITVYVDAPDPKDPLPSIVFTQASGYWQNWRSEQTLVRGKNVLTVPEFLVEPNGAGGGPIYIANGYEKTQQSQGIKLYIEGGFFFPMFRFGDDEDAFKSMLDTYEQERLADPTHIVDVCEIVGDHFINTTKSSNAYTHYITGSVSPQKNTESWEKYMTGILAFDGISMDPDDPHFNEKNLHLPVNFRIAHWSGYAAYAVGEHIGLVALGHGSLTNLVAPGWGLSHEIGHMIDLGERTKAETTNNMIAVYGDVLMNNTINTGKAQHIVSPSALYPDETATAYNYFHKNGSSISQWWNLEAAYPGFWGKLDNAYRYYDRAAAFTKAGVTAKAEQEAFNMTEKMVYFSSIATGIDLGYYYERYGFGFDGTAFTVENASPAYKKLVAQAIKDGVLSTEQYKYWYFDINQYFHAVDERACYDATGSVEIREVWKNNGGYTLVLPAPADADRHLGYEIKEYRDGNWYVIGFTHSQSFTDTTAYADGYTPKYKISAYDRQLNHTADSAEKSYAVVSQTDVCRIGDVYYDTLGEAIAAAAAGDTVYLCADTKEAAITVNKNITILPDPSLTGDVVITRCATSSVFAVSGGTVTIGKNEENASRIIMDGFSFSQAGPLIAVSGGTLYLYNTVLRNNISTSNGGAIAVTAAGGKLYAYYSELTGNTAANGGAIYSVGTVNIINCKITDNRASGSGGAVANYSGGVMAFSTNCTVSGNAAAQNGGGFALDGKTVLTDTHISGNSAGGSGGGLYMSLSGASRTATLNGGAVTDNTAKNGGALYLNAGTLYLGASGGSGTAFSGDIYKNQGAIRLKTAALDFSASAFYLPTVADGTVLLTADGITLTEELSKTVRVHLGAARLDEGKTNVLADRAVAEITINVNGQSVNLDHTVGWEFTLPETTDGMTIPEDKLFDCWEINGVRYNAGDRLVIDGATEIRAVLKDKPKDAPQTPPEKPSENPTGKTSRKSNAAGIAIGVTVGVVALAAAAFVAWLFLFKKRKNRK